MAQRRQTKKGGENQVIGGAILGGIFGGVLGGPGGAIIGGFVGAMLAELKGSSYPK